MVVLRGGSGGPGNDSGGPGDDSGGVWTPVVLALILGVGSGGPEGWFWWSWGWFWWSWGWFWNLVVLGLVLVILESGGPFR
jgi:hypothetical protein